MVKYSKVKIIILALNSDVNHKGEASGGHLGRENKLEDSNKKTGCIILQLWYNIK
jgi:hypothetical protein